MYFQEGRYNISVDNLIPMAAFINGAIYMPHRLTTHPLKSTKEKSVARSKQVYIEWMEATVLLTMKPRKRAATYRHKRYDQQNALPILYDSAGPALLPEATSFSWGLPS
jgi:hypothetical protein